MQDQTIHFIGGGNMATAMLSGVTARPDAPPVVICDPNPEVRARHEDLGRETIASLSELREVQVAVLAFKPQHFQGAIDALKAALAEDALVISVMVGISTTTIADALPGVRIVRTMPNTPMAVGEGMTGVAAGIGASEADVALATFICSCSGQVLQVKESQIDDIAAVSGSGPAYVFRFCEAMVHAAQSQCGFSEAEAEQLVRQTVLGAVTYLCQQEGFPAARLREQVTSPGGTTQAALSVINDAELDAIMVNAMEAAQRRAKELNADVH